MVHGRTFRCKFKNVYEKSKEEITLGDRIKFFVNPEDANEALDPESTTISGGWGSLMVGGLLVVLVLVVMI